MRILRLGYLSKPHPRYKVVGVQQSWPPSKYVFSQLNI
jgi:hypothetical protein